MILYNFATPITISVPGHRPVEVTAVYGDVDEKGWAGGDNFVSLPYVVLIIRHLLTPASRPYRAVFEVEDIRVAVIQNHIVSFQKGVDDPHKTGTLSLERVSQE